MTESVDEQAARITALQSVLLLAFIEAHGAAPMFALEPLAATLDKWGVTADASKADPDAIAAAMKEVPPWMREHARQHQQPVPTEPEHTGVQETSRVRKAPKRPKKIPKSRMGVVKSV